jgi:hypothetical protein
MAEENLIIKQRLLNAEKMLTDLKKAYDPIRRNCAEIGRELRRRKQSPNRFYSTEEGKEHTQMLEANLEQKKQFLKDFNKKRGILNKKIKNLRDKLKTREKPSTTDKPSKFSAEVQTKAAALPTQNSADKEKYRLPSLTPDQQAVFTKAATIASGIIHRNPDLYSPEKQSEILFNIVGLLSADKPNLRDFYRFNFSPHNKAVRDKVEFGVNVAKYPSYIQWNTKNGIPFPTPEGLKSGKFYEKQAAVLKNLYHKNAEGYASGWKRAEEVRQEKKGREINSPADIVTKVLIPAAARTLRVAP